MFLLRSCLHCLGDLHLEGARLEAVCLQCGREPTEPGKVRCRTCGAYLPPNVYKFCPVCGQAVEAERSMGYAS